MIINLKNKNQFDLLRLGMLGKPVFLPFWLSWGYLGDTRDQFGRYQRRNGKNGRILVRTRHYWPRDNPTARQLQIRQAFKDGVAHWHTLTQQEKDVYNNKRYPTGQTGFTRHMTEYIKDHI